MSEQKQISAVGAESSLTKLTFEDAQKLFEECERFCDGTLNPLSQSLLRIVTKKVFGQDQVYHMHKVCSMVFRAIAQDHMKKAKEVKFMSNVPPQLMLDTLAVLKQIEGKKNGN